MLSRLLCAFVLLAFSGPLIGQQSSISTSSGHKPIPPSQQEQFIPYWTAEPGWHTELMLRNNLDVGTLQVTPVLRLTNGDEITLPEVSIAPATVESVNLHDVLMKSHPEVMSLTDPYGSVALRYKSVFSSNLYPSAMIHDDGHPIIFHLDGSQAGVGSGSGSHEGIWWLPKETTKGYLVLTNMSKKEQNGVLRLYDQSGNASKQTVSLPAGQTLRFSLRDMVSRSGLKGIQGGVSFRMEGDVNTVNSTLILFDETAGFSATMKTFVLDPAVTLKSHDFSGVGKWITHAPMLALENPDPALQLPSQVMLHPEIFLRNTTSKTVESELSFHWRNAQRNGRAHLPKISLAPLETRVIDVKQLQDNGAIPADAAWSQVTLTTNTLPNEVMAVAASFDDTLRYGAQTPFSDQMAFHLEGAAWEVDQNHDSIIAAGNGSSKPVKARLTFFYAGGTQKYQIEQTIAPDDQMWVDVGKLIYNGVPDKNGNVMPSDLTTGAYQLLDLDDTPSPSLYEGKVVTDKTYGHATYGCMICCGYRVAEFNPNPVFASIGDFSALDAEGTSACTGGIHWVSVDGYADPGSWISNNPAVMTEQPRKVHGVSVGSATANVDLVNIMYGPPVDSGAGNPCPLQDVPVSGSGNVDRLAGFRVSVVNPAPSGTSNSVISKASNQIKVTAVNPAGTVLTSYSGSVSLTSTDTLATLPGNYTFTAADGGSHIFAVTLVTVNFNSSTRDITIKDTSSGVSTTQNIYVWFNIIASDEGLVGGVTAYGHTIVPNDHFVALPSTGLGNVPVVLQRNSTQQVTTVLDVGPWCPHSSATTGNPCVCASDPYWSTSGIPFAATNSCSSDHAGIDLADGTFSALGLTGNGNIYWRFQ